MKQFFISFSGEDADLAEYLRRTLNHLFQGDGGFFASAGGVGSGELWLDRLKGEIRTADTILVLLSPRSIRAPWINIESGVFWYEGKNIVPLLHGGLQPEDLHRPLSDYQATTISSPKGMVDLISTLAARMGLDVPPMYDATTLSGRVAELDRGLIEPPSPLPDTRTALPASDPMAARGPKSWPQELEWGFLLESVVDATLCLVDKKDAQADIEKHISQGWVIPTRYHYETDVGAEKWLQLCKNDNYRLRQNTMAYWLSEDGRDMAEVIRGHLRPHEQRLDFISLGPGDGEKDATLISDWLSAGLDVFYYPYDVSLRLAAHAAQRVRRDAVLSPRGSLHAKVVLADFWELATMREVINYRDAPNVIALLGTLGNLANDRQYLSDLRSCMHETDVLLLEVRLKSSVESEAKSEKMLLESDDNSLKHDFSPLANYFGLRFDKDNICTPTLPGLSRIDDRITETTVVTYIGPAPEGKVWPDDGVRLQYIHKYDGDEFLRQVQKIGFEILHKFASEKGFLECLLRRR